MALLTRHVSVLDLGPDIDTSGKRRIFTREPDDPTDVPDIVYIPTELWEELGQPDQITVTVRAGDRLNEE